MKIDFRLQRDFIYPLVLVIIGNAPFWILGEFLVLKMRPLIDIDLNVGFIFASFGLYFSLLSIVLAWSIDAMQSIMFIYHFPLIGELVGSVKFTSLLNLMDFITWPSFVFVLLFALCLSLIGVIVHRDLCSKRGLIGLTVLILLADILNGSASWSLIKRETYLLAFNISGSPAVSILKGIDLGNSIPHVRLVELASSTGQIDPVGWAMKNPDGNIFIAVVESLGQQKNVLMQDWLDREIFNAMSNKWLSSKSFVVSSGGTTYGELRTLCRLTGHYSFLTLENSSGCLPRIFLSMGKKSVGFHGFTRKMFERGEWWPVIGFDRYFFEEDFPSAPRCGGAFRGICDGFIVDRIQEELQNSGRLVYHLTLNTHLPIANVKLSAELNQICQGQGISDSQCQLVGQQGQYFRQLGGMLSSLNNAPLIIIVGDHPPPFVVKSIRAGFVENIVPQYTFLPN
jgi:hypothetical protein